MKHSEIVKEFTDKLYNSDFAKEFNLDLGECRTVAKVLANPHNLDKRYFSRNTITKIFTQYTHLTREDLAFYSADFLTIHKPYTHKQPNGIYLYSFTNLFSISYIKKEYVKFNTVHTTTVAKYELCRNINDLTELDYDDIKQTHKIDPYKPNPINGHVEYLEKFMFMSESRKKEAEDLYYNKFDELVEEYLNDPIMSIINGEFIEAISVDTKHTTDTIYNFDILNIEEAIDVYKGQKIDAQNYMILQDTSIKEQEVYKQELKKSTQRSLKLHQLISGAYKKETRDDYNS